MNFFKKIFGLLDPKPKVITPEQELEYQAAKAELEKYKRIAYIPQLTEVVSEFSADTKFGGYPYLRNDKDWPICPTCKKHMQFLYQLNLNELPERKADGLIQVFYCLSFKCIDEIVEWDYPLANWNICRKIDVKENPTIINPPVCDEVFTERRVLKWEPKDDYPNSDEYEKLGLFVNIDTRLLLSARSECQTIWVDNYKLFGWADWLQEAPCIKGKKKGAEMVFLIQGAEHDITDWSGAYLMQNPDDLSELTFIVQAD